MTIETFPAQNPGYNVVLPTQDPDSYGDLPIAAAVAVVPHPQLQQHQQPYVQTILPAANQTGAPLPQTQPYQQQQPYVPSTYQTNANQQQFTPPVSANVVPGTIRPPGQTQGNSAVPPRIETNLGRRPVQLTCPYCQREGLTKTRIGYDAGSCIWIIATALICWPLAVAPCCVTSLRETEHCCRFCNKKVGVTSSFSDCC